MAYNPNEDLPSYGGTYLPPSEPGAESYVKPVGQGSWGPWGYDNGVFVPGRGRDPFAEGRTVERSKGYEIDWQLLKDWAIDYRFELGIALATGALVTLYIREPEKYGAVIQSFMHMVGEITKGVGEVIPG